MTILLGVSYAHSLTAAFVFDDDVSIVENSSIRRLRPLTAVLTAPTEGGRTHDGRPLLNLSLALNYAAHGLWRPGFRLVNLGIHLINALLVCDVSRRLLRWLPAWQREASFLAACSAVLWAVHPLHTNVNTYVIQRAESLAASFILGALDAALIGLSTGSLPAVAVAVALAVIGAAVKETTAAILPLVAACDWAFRTRLLAARLDWRLRPTVYIGLALNLVVIGGLAVVLGGRGGSAGLTSASVWAYALTQCRAIWFYAATLFWPAALVLDHGDRLATGIGQVWPAVLATTVLVGGVAAGFVWRPRVFLPLAAAAILLAPTTSIVPVKTQTIAEHRMYLPAAFILSGIVVAAAACAQLGQGRITSRMKRAAIMGVAAIVATASVARTVVRNRDYATAVTLWRQNVRDCPANDRGATNLVAALIREGRFADALPLALAAVDLRPDRERNWLNLGRLLAEAGRDAEAVQAFQTAIGLAPGEADARINLGIVLSRGADTEAAITTIDAAIVLRPDLAKGWLARGMVRLRQDRPDLALPDLETAVRLDPENPAGWHNLKLALMTIAVEPQHMNDRRIAP